jgi:hypothetical protein
MGRGPMRGGRSLLEGAVGTPPAHTGAHWMTLAVMNGAHGMTLAPANQFDLNR